MIRYGHTPDPVWAHVCLKQITYSLQISTGPGDCKLSYSLSYLVLFERKLALFRDNKVFFRMKMDTFGQ